jgi:hypothetical protein
MQSALEQIKRLPSDRQDELAVMLLAAAESSTRGLHLTQEQKAEIEARLTSADELIDAGEVKAELLALLG